MPETVAGPTGVLLLDKPAGITSTRALAVARRLLGSRRAGHTGTLDPFATGLLPLAFGEATKFSRFLLDAPKQYRASLRLGFASTTGDPEGEISEIGGRIPDLRTIDEVLASFVGVSQQVPPMHSAIHHEGRRLYDLARAGEEVVRQPRSIHVYSIKVVANSVENLVISVNCSKGTYVRTLAEDIGRKLGCGAYLSDLRRTAVGEFRLEQAATLEALEAAGRDGARGLLLPPESLVARLERREIGVHEAEDFLHGRSLESDRGEGEVGVFAPGGRFLGVGLRDGAGRLLPVRLMRRDAQPDVPDFA